MPCASSVSLMFHFICCFNAELALWEDQDNDVAFGKLMN